MGGPDDLTLKDPGAGGFTTLCTAAWAGLCRELREHREEDAPRGRSEISYADVLRMIEYYSPLRDP